MIKLNVLFGAIFALLILSISVSAQGNRNLVFLNQPQDISPALPFPNEIQIAVVDQDGNIINDATDEITLSLKTESFPAELMGTTTEIAINGIATFSNLTINQEGSFQLVAHKPVQKSGNWKDTVLDPNDNSVYTDIWAEGDVAYIGRWEPGGVNFIDISDPTQLELIHHWHENEESNVIKDLKVKDNIGYFASDNGGGVYLVDVSDPTNPIDLSNISTQNNGYSHVHNLFVKNDYLYLASFREAEVAVFNVSNPENPVFIRKIPSEYVPYIHDITVKDGILFTSSTGLNNTGYTEIFDVSDVENEYVRLGGFFTGSGTHSNWPTENLNYLAVAIESEGEPVNIWDVSDPTNGSLVSELFSLYLDEPPYSPHNPVIIGNRLYVSWYQSGLQIFDISEITNPQLIGFYDTFKENEGRFAGAWGVYPLLGEDRVLVSDTKNGLFIFDTSTANAGVAISEAFQVSSGTSISDREWRLY